MLLNTLGRAILVLLASICLPGINMSGSLNRENLTTFPAAAQNGKTSSGIEILTDTEGVDFNSYLRELYLSVRKRWYANMPPSVALGEQGTNCVEFRILRDGTVPNDFAKLSVRSGKEALDRTSLQAIRQAAPFNHLPEKFSQLFVVLRLTFYYNVKPPQR